MREERKKKKYPWYRLQTSPFSIIYKRRVPDNVYVLAFQSHAAALSALHTALGHPEARSPCGGAFSPSSVALCLKRTNDAWTL